jgi:TonB-linked SusC/RagA family outer membrane protein
MRKIVFMLAFLFIGMQVFAQTTITGTVTDNNGDPVPGANVWPKGFTDVGTITDMDGNYTLSAPTEATSLIFSFMGMKTQEVTIGGQTTINVALENEDQVIDDVVVTALGITREKKSLGYSVQEVSADEISQSSKSNVVSALQGKVSGVYINNSSGAAGSGTDIIIRGVTSLSPGSDNQPLFVIDGVPVSNETSAGNVQPTEGSNSPGSSEQFSFSNRAIDFNPNDVESISVLKGTAATALYGIRAANGAVIITTKRGKSGKPSFQFNSSVAWDQVNKYPEIQTVYREGYYTRGRAFPDANDPYGYSYGFQTWGPEYLPNESAFMNYENFFRTGLKFDNNFSVSGGSDNGSYYVSASNTNQEGIVPNTDWSRTTLKFAGNIKLHEKFTLDGSVSFATSGGQRPNGGDKSIMSSLSYWSPGIDITDYQFPDGRQKNYSQGVIDNPMFFAENSTLTDMVNRWISSLGFKWDIADWVNVSYKLGYDSYTDSRNRFVLPELDVGTKVGGFVIDENHNYSSLNSFLNVTFNHSFSEDLNLTVMLGNQIEDIHRTRLTTRGEGLNIPDFNSLTNATNFYTDPSESRQRVIGVLADIRLDYKNMLFLNVTGRNDWASTLPEDNRSFFYPSVNLSFLFTEVLPQNDILTFGKLRASWGQVGKIAPPNVVGRFYSADPNFPFAGIGGFIQNSTAGDENLKPETTSSFELGTDMRFLKNRIRLDFTYFVQNSKDQILAVPISNATSLSRFWLNAGEIETKGMEVLLDADILKTGDFKWNATLNWSTNESEVLSMPEELDEIIFADAGWPGVVSKIVEGGSPGDLYGYVYRYENDQLYIDGTGFPTIITDSVVPVGNAFPDWIGSLNNSFSYKGFTFSFLWEWKKGGDVYDAGQRNSIRNGVLKITEPRYVDVVFNGVMDDGSDGYIPNDQEVRIDRNFYRSSYDYNRASEILIQDASWLRLRNVKLTYNFPKAMIEKAKIENLALSVSGYNLLLFTPFRGYDPEGTQYSSGSNTFGFTGLNVPSTKGFLVGLNISF